MELKEYKEIRNKRYLPKEVLGYLIVSAENVTDKNLESLIVSFENELLRHMKDKNILEKLDENLLKKIINYWNMSISQAVAYAYIVFHTIMFEEKGFSRENIADMFAYTMRLYSPDNAEDFVNQKNNNFGVDVK